MLRAFLVVGALAAVLADLDLTTLKEKRFISQGRLDINCAGCFPNDRSKCEDNVWVPCCGEQLDCQFYRCSAAVLGQLPVGTNLVLKRKILSDCDEPVTLHEGWFGRVIHSTEEHDYYLEWRQREEDDNFTEAWTTRYNFWQYSDMPSYMSRSNAAHLAHCLVHCDRETKCWNAGKKKNKKLPNNLQSKHDECTSSCKARAEDCLADQECQEYMSKFEKCFAYTARGCARLKPEPFENYDLEGVTKSVLEMDEEDAQKPRPSPWERRGKASMRQGSTHDEF